MRPRRRRGVELEHALLDAAWDELTEVGYGNFTVEAVAQRAATSRPVVYRRWVNKQQLVAAAIKHASRQTQPPRPDTGTLRGDLLAMMQLANNHRLRFAAAISVHLGDYFQETGTAPADLRELILDGNRTHLDTVIERAIKRGEIDPTRLTPRIADLAFALFRHEVLMTLQPVPDAVMEEIIDSIFLPLVSPASARPE